MENKTLQTKLNSALMEMQNPTLDKINPFHKSKYADLCGVLHAIKPVLTKHKLSLMQIPDFLENKLKIITIIADDTNELRFESFFPNTQTDPQKIGAVITYFRRYSLLTIFGLFGEEDDDANITIKQKEPIQTKQSEKVKELKELVQNKPVSKDSIEEIKKEISIVLNGMGIKKADHLKQVEKAKEALKLNEIEGMKLGIAAWKKILEYFKADQTNLQF